MRVAQGDLVAVRIDDARVARRAGIPAIVLLILALLAGAAFQLGWISLGAATPSVAPPLFVTTLALSLILPPVAVLPFAVGAFLGRETRLGSLLFGLFALAVPHLLARQLLPGGTLGDAPPDAAEAVLLGGLGVGVGLLEAPLWALFGVVLFRTARRRARGGEFRAREKANMRAARRLYEEALGAGDASVVDELVSEDFRDLKSGARGRLGMERAISSLRRSYPDLSVTVEDQDAEGDLVRTRLVLSGTDEGGVMWYPPTGRRASFSAVFADRFRDGRLVEHAGETDTEGLLRQLGRPV